MCSIAKTRLDPAAHLAVDQCDLAIDLSELRQRGLEVI